MHHHFLNKLPLVKITFSLIHTGHQACIDLYSLTCVILRDVPFYAFFWFGINKYKLTQLRIGS